MTPSFKSPIRNPQANPSSKCRPEAVKLQLSNTFNLNKVFRNTLYLCITKKNNLISLQPSLKNLRLDRSDSIINEESIYHL